MATRADDVGALYQGERARLARATGSIAGDSAEDVVHDAFLTYLTRSDEVVSPKAWLERVARNRALNHRRGPRQVPLVVDLADEQGPSEPERQATRALVADALADLDPRSLTALRLRFFEERSYDEIAGALEVRVAQAHVVVHRAVKRLGRAIVRRLATAHDAAACVPALEGLIGVGNGALDHDDGCSRCAPVVDELAALRGLGVLAPAAGLLPRLSASVGARATPLADAIAHVSNALVALGLAVASLATPAIATQASHEPPSEPAATVTEPEERGLRAERRSTAPTRTRSRADDVAPDTRTVADVGPVVISGDEEHKQAEVKGQEDEPIGGVVVCEPLQPCPPPPSP